MSYSVTWDGGYEASPDGATVDADTLDTIVQELKVAIRERMNTILDPSGQWDDDPIVLKPNRVGAVLLLPASAWQSWNENGDAVFGDGSFRSEGTGSNQGAFMPLPLHSNWKVTKIEAILDADTVGSITPSFNKSTFTNTPTTSVISDFTLSTSGITVVTVFSGTEIISANDTYWLYVTSTGSSGDKWYGYGVRVTYDEV
jgi:hypothetical protein